MKFDMALCGGILHTSGVQLGSDTTANCDIRQALIRSTDNNTSKHTHSGDTEEQF